MSHYNIRRKPPVNPQGAWAEASYQLTWAIEEVTPRTDLIVKIAPDAAYDDNAYDQDGNLIRDENGNPVASQHAAVTFLETAIVEINPNLLPKDFNLTDFHPLDKQNRKQYPVVWGAVIHEAAHANHSNWILEINRRMQNGKLSPLEKLWAGAALLLEESRIEKYQIQERPQDQPWLETAGMRVAVQEYGEAARAVEQFKKENPGTDIGKLSRYKCARAAALALARIDSGSIYPNTDIIEVENIVKSAFGEDYDKLRAIWVEAQATADDDADGMLELGHRWYDLTRDSGDDQQPMGVTVQPNSNSNQGDYIDQQLSDAAEKTEKEVSGKSEEERREQRSQKARAAAEIEAKARREAHQQADQAFNGAGAPGNAGHPVTGYRKPTREEVTLARVTRIRLQNAYVPEKAVTKITQPTPPGRMSGRAMQQRVAQRGMGMVPSTEPFTYTDRRHVTTPPLKVGIIQDVSASQRPACAAATSGAWSLAKAANEIPDAKVAMVGFGNGVYSIIKPLTKVGDVPVIPANHGTHHFVDSLTALEGELDLMRGGAARLVVILTDGEFHSEEDIQYKDAALRRLTERGVKVLWVNTRKTRPGDRDPERMPGLHIVHGFADAAKLICREAVTALTKGQ